MYKKLYSLTGNIEQKICVCVNNIYELGYSCYDLFSSVSILAIIHLQRAVLMVMSTYGMDSTRNDSASSTATMHQFLHSVLVMMVSLGQ